MSRNLSQHWKPPYSLPHYVTLFDERRLIQQPPRAITNWRINHPLAEDVEGTSAARCWSWLPPLTLSGEHCHRCCQVLVNGCLLHSFRWALPPLLPGDGQWLPPFTIAGEHCHRCCQVLVNGYPLYPLRWALPPLLQGVGQWLDRLNFFFF